MGKLMGILLLALALVLPAKAEWLFWTVDFDESGAESPWPDPNADPLVWLVVSTDPASSVGGTTISSSAVPVEGGQSMGGLSVTDLQGYESSAYTFFIEMGALAGQADYMSQGMTYNDLVSAGFVKSDMAAIDGFWNPEVWMPTHVIPEPTGGLLVVFGCAMLALRRRRMPVM